MTSYSIVEKLLKDRGEKIVDLAAATGISNSTLSDWKRGKYVPKMDKMQKIADYFGISVDYLLTGKDTEKESSSGEKYYFTDETAAIAQDVFDDPELRVLFDAAKGSRPEDIRMAAEMLKRFKMTNPDG